jgi:hypothetical protein
LAAPPTPPAECNPKGKTEKTEKTETTISFWEILYDRLNPLVPSISDGAEHKTVTMLQQALTEPTTTQAEKNYRNYVIKLLETISANFSEYAKQSKNAELVQVEHPTTSGEMVYQTNHSAPYYEAAL